ncbi:hypothetical protein CASFOL_019422 [Castilleja foliolosa]|uniref:Uncharacterized protein n=1 Tax=Castilleja foliolosa TaxID=1961234 RepID=A0ABD3D4A9_9LAMI
MISTFSTRSSSFPSRKSQHIITTTSSSSLSSIDEKLHNLQNLHKRVDDLLLSPHTHHIFAQQRHEKWVDDILDGYLSLVDSCAMAKDSVSHSKEYILNLLSVLRRRRDSDDQLCKLMSSRKIMKKNIQKSFRKITSFKNKSSTSVTGKDREIVAIVSMLKEAELATLDLFQALLLSMVGAKGHSRTNVWFIVSMLVGSRKVSCQEQKYTKTLDFGDLDSKLVHFRASKCESGEQIEKLQKQLTDMDSIIQGVEEKLESLFKHLIRSRVSLLNMQCQL